MANTAITFDVVRSELTETRFTLSRKAADITSPAQKNNVYQWPGTHTYTLQPINLTPDFSQTNHWEPAKFRLADCTFDAAWWTEAPDNTTKGVGPCDYFIHGVVKNTNYVLGENVFKNLVGTLTQTGINAVNFTQRDMVKALVSKASMPANQGYCIRFRVDGRETIRRGSFLEFYFAQFMVRFNSDGMAELWQSTDFVNYAVVYSFQWAHVDQIHGRSHQVIIFPHCRNRIEFLCSTGYQATLGVTAIWGRLLWDRPVAGHGIYEIPGPVQFMPDGTTPLIALANPWTMAVSREFRPKFQVSKLLFANGTNRTSYFWDTPADITSRTGVAFPPEIPLQCSTEYDTNGGTVTWVLENADTGERPFKSDGMSTKVGFGFGMQGKGDVPGPGLGSTITPEFYGYVIDKAPGFFTYDRQPYTCPLSIIKLDHGTHPEEERSSITCYDPGAYLRYSERGDIPIEIGDLDSGLLYFEGSIHMMEAGEAPAHTPIGLHAEARGMIDNFLRMDWGDAPPDFEKDPQDPAMRPYLFAEMIRVCFEAAGEPRDTVVIEEEEKYLKNFRIWPKELAAGGGFQGGSAGANIGSGHKTGVSHSSVWQPACDHKVHEFQDHVIRDILGWNWMRDRSDRKWHIYKRPDPLLQADIDAGKMNPKVEFYSDGKPPIGWNSKALPSYKHSDLKKSLKRPICSTIIVSAFLDTGAIQSAADLGAALGEASDASLDNPTDSDFSSGTHKNYQTFTNKFGYKNPKNLHPNINHPDFLGRNHIRKHHITRAQNMDGLAWIGRRLFEDNCFGYLHRTFEADWGDEFTYNLRKWDMCLLNGERHWIMRVEPTWSDKKFRRAHYSVVKFRDDVRPPR